MQPITSADRRHAPPSCSLDNDSSLTALPAFACTQVSGDVTAILDPTTPTGLITTITGGADPAIIVYSTASSYDGDFTTPGTAVYATARIGADALCAADQARAGRSCTSVHALISLTASTDEIAGMPNKYSIPDLPLKSPTGTTIANHWADTLAGSTRLIVSMSAAGVTSQTYWSFSLANGSIAAKACAGGTSALGTTFGELGVQSSTGPEWLYTVPSPSANDQSCDTAGLMLCVCY